MTDLERCARALRDFDVARRYGKVPSNHYSMDERAIKETWIPFVRAVLECLKTPSEGMIEAGGPGARRGVAREAWTAMINHILKGE